MEELTAQEREVLAFERTGWRSPDLKAQAIKETFGWSAARHEQYVSHVIDLPAALAYDPVLVNRLRRLRDTRRQLRRAG